MKIFITGASGFVGGAIAKKLKENHSIYAMARSDSSAKKVSDLGLIPIKTALNNVKIEDVEGMDMIIHSAAFVDAWGTKAQYWDANVKGTEQLMAIAKEAGVKKFIHISTEACLFYGQAMDDIDETYPYAANSPYLYSQTKAAAEKLVLAANEPGVFETMALRPRMVWGPGDQTILPELVKMVKKGAFIWVNQGKSMTSTTHVQNFVHGLELAIEKGKSGEAYFITDGTPISIKQFITELLDTQNIIPTTKSVSPSVLRPFAKIIEKTWRFLGIKKEPFITRFAADVMSVNCTINLDKARNQLGYQPIISIEQGMKELKSLI